MKDTAKMYFRGDSVRPVSTGANTRNTQMKDFQRPNLNREEPPGLALNPGAR